MKLIITITSLAAIVAASDFGNTCTGEKLDAAAEILSATCGTGDGKGTTDETSLDLNKCFKYADGQIQFGLDGNFGKSCDNCYVHRVQDPVWPGSQHPTLNCTCDGSMNEASLNLDYTPILNKYGKLQCID